MRLRHLPLFIAVLTGAAVLSGCGSPSYTTYSDSTYGFSVQYPSGWSAPKVSQGTADGVRSHLVAFTADSGQVRIAVNMVRPDFSSIRDGQVTQQNGQTLTFHRRTVAGKPAVLIVGQSTGMPVNQESVHFNTVRYGYDIQVVSPGTLDKSLRGDFLHIVNSFKLGKKG